MTNFFILTLLILFLGFNQIKSQNNYITHSDSINVLHYDIRLNITDFTNKRISGYTELTILSRINNLNNISLDLLTMQIDSIIINDNKVISYNYNDTLLKLPAPQSISINDTLIVRIYYAGKPQQDPGINGWGGFKWSGNTAYNLGVGFEANPHNFGRCWYPCIDDFVDRAKYDLHITVDANLNHTAVCGGTLMSVTENGDGTRTFHWRINQDIPTYLNSVAVGEYICIADTFNSLLGSLPVHIYAFVEDSHKVWGSFPKLEDIFHIFEDKFGPYRWDRIGYVAVNFNSGAMEHAMNTAYPKMCFNNTNNYESLYAHELFHSWFGNLITCRTALDMWINEGWASYSESVYREDLYGIDVAKQYRRVYHTKNLRYNHIEDGDYYSIYGIPHEMTYSNTVYKKGADVVHSLRAHMGDSLFFNTVKKLLDDYQYKDIDSQEMCDYLSTQSGMNLQGFFNSWVFTPGFPHFSVDSFLTTSNGYNYDVRIWLREKLKGRNTYSENVRFEISFMNNNRDIHTEMVNFSGPLYDTVFTVPFNPNFIIVDIDEKTADATTDMYLNINTTGNFDFPQTHFAGVVQEISDSAFVRVEHNWVAPDSLKTPIKGLFLSPNRYWKIDGVFPSDFVMQGKFNYNRSTSTITGWLDQELITNVVDSLVLLYRPNTKTDWIILNTSRIGNSGIGNLFADSIKQGEYCLGIWDWSLYTSLNNKATGNNHFKIFPNPTNNSITIELNDEQNGLLHIFNSIGQVVAIKKIDAPVSVLELDVSAFPEGNYLIVLNNDFNKITGRFIKK